MKIENNLFKIIKKEIKVFEIDDYVESMDGEDVEFLKKWKGEKDKVYFCYLGWGSVKCWEEGKKWNEIKKSNVEFNDVKVFKNVIFGEDGFWVKVS